MCAWLCGEKRREERERCVYWNGVTVSSMVSQTLSVCCVLCVHGCMVRDKGKRGRDVYTHLHKFVLVCMRF